MSLFARTARALINTWCAFHIKLLRTLVFCCWDGGMVGVVIIALVALLCYVFFYTMMSDVLILRPGYARSKRVTGVLKMDVTLYLNHALCTGLNDVKDWLLDDSLHETFEIRKKIFLINLIDFNPLYTFRQSFTGISPLKYVFLPFFISKHISLFLFIATKHDVICKTGQI